MSDHPRFKAAAPADLDCKECAAPGGEPCRRRRPCADERPTVRLTECQAHVLWVVAEHAPITAADVAGHLRLAVTQARSTLATLERRRLIDATYTNVRPGRRGRGYTATSRGREVAQAREGSEEDL